MIRKLFLQILLLITFHLIVYFQKQPVKTGKSKAELQLSEPIRPISGWENSNLRLTKEFLACVSYPLTLTDLAQNSSTTLINIQNATYVSLEYGQHDDYSIFSFASNGGIVAPNTITSNSICKANCIYTRLLGNIPDGSLQGRAYVHTYWGKDSYNVCIYSELPYFHGYNPASGWFNVGTDNWLYHQGRKLTQFGGIGLNRASTSPFHPLPSDIANQYLFGVSSIQFRLQNLPDLSVVYQCYVKDVGWLPASCDGEENGYQHDKPISSFRMNLVPKTEKQHLLDFWNRDVGTNHIN